MSDPVKLLLLTVATLAFSFAFVYAYSNYDNAIDELGPEDGPTTDVHLTLRVPSESRLSPHETIEEVITEILGDLPSDTFDISARSGDDVVLVAITIHQDLPHEELHQILAALKSDSARVHLENFCEPVKCQVLDVVHHEPEQHHDHDGHHSH